MQRCIKVHLVFWTSVLGLLCLGCTSSLFSKKNAEQELPTETEFKQRLVRDMARPWGLSRGRVEGIALATNLRGTGSDPPPSSRRNVLIDDMNRRSVSKPNRFLASTNTSLVITRSSIPPAAQKGDRIDVLVTVPSRSETTSLHNGWLMNSRLQEMAALGNKIRTGHTLAYSEGAILIDSLANGDTGRSSKTRGRILGGGIVTKSRAIGLALKKEHLSFTASRLIGEAVNRRFHTFDHGIKKGAATPKRDDFIELAVQPQYRNNLLRYVRVIESLAVSESNPRRIDRLNRLRHELLDPSTSVDAALQLEAVGHESSPILLEGLRSSEPLVKFYSAEALAYLNHDAAIQPLADAAANESSFRSRALIALGAMTNLNSHEALSGLLHDESAETRYGAFHALQDANPRDPVVRGENLNNILALHVIPSTSSPMIHVRKTERPEIVIFGSELVFEPPFAISMSDILVKSNRDRVKITKFSVADDKSVVTSNKVDDVIRGIVKVGGSYTDVVAAIGEAKKTGSILSRVRFDALPKTGRTFNREVTESDEPIGSGSQSAAQKSEVKAEDAEAEDADAEDDRF